MCHWSGIPKADIRCYKKLLSTKMTIEHHFPKHVPVRIGWPYHLPSKWVHFGEWKSMQQLFKDNKYKTGLGTLCKIHLNKGGSLVPKALGNLHTTVLSLRVTISNLLRNLRVIIKKSTNCHLKQHFPTDSIVESLFSSITLTTIPGTQCSIEHTSENLDLEHVFFRYSIACHLHGWPVSRGLQNKRIFPPSSHLPEISTIISSFKDLWKDIHIIMGLGIVSSGKNKSLAS